MSNEFFTNIPHDFGMKELPVISHVGVVRQKVRLLERLLDLNTNHKLLINSMEMLAEKNPADVYYKILNCHLNAMDKSAPEFQHIITAVENTHAPTHSGFRLEVDSVFEL